MHMAEADCCGDKQAFKLLFDEFYMALLSVAEK